MDVLEGTSALGWKERWVSLLSAPRRLFQSIPAQPSSPFNWAVPLMVAVVLGVVAALGMFTRAELVDLIHAAQESSIQRQQDSGKITAEQARQTRQTLQQMGPSILRAALVMTAIVSAVAGTLWWATLLWMVSRSILRFSLPFQQALEVAALAAIVKGLSAVVGVILALSTGRLITGPHLGAFVANFDSGNRLHLGLAVLNPFSLWHLGLLALGLATLSGRNFRGVLGVLGTLWIGYKLIAVALVLPQFAL